ncbi:hypothetical protein AVEN_50934-1 [Araneus ventricosus]|uniref:Uncharacterized protein n=1 Tax=Araneus ventricosus TaxID=182803 RepID=A0A4Y2IH97_ARAVE|nr:hypothetical protein AVEN_50934-1 [Araneus ventricosus]
MDDKSNLFLKNAFFRSQLTLSVEHEKALSDISLFIATVYVIPWLNCSVSVKAPKQDLCFLKSLKSYERIDETVSGAALKKFIQHLCYLSEELPVLFLFDEDVDVQEKMKIVADLDRECLHMERKNIPSVQEAAGELIDKTLNDFVSTKSKDFFYRLHMKTCFLQECPST